MFAQAGYTIEDVMPFTADVYQRLAERQIETFAPGQYIALLLGVAAVALAARGYFRSVASVLGVVWAWVAITFHFRLFAELTWVANYLGGAFIAQALLIVAIAWWGGFRVGNDSRRSRVAVSTGFLLAAGGLIAYPLLDLIGQEGVQSQWFAMSPDPTVVVTLGLLLVACRPLWWLLLMPIPLAWAAVSLAISDSLYLPRDWVLIAAVVLAVASAGWAIFVCVWGKGRVGQSTAAADQLDHDL